MNGRVIDPRMPVLVGVGVASDDMEAIGLMTEAVRRACLDAGPGCSPTKLDRLAVPEGSWSHESPGRLVADRLGAASARTHFYQLGIPQQSLINGALAAILSGESDLAVVVGGESKRWARNEERAGRPVPSLAGDPGRGDILHERRGPIVEPVEVAHRLWDPVQQYAMIENALRHAEGRSVTGQAGLTSGLWARFNQVARNNPQAAFATPRSADEIATPTRDNRPLAFPYNKWHSTQWVVDQAAALVFASFGEAERMGIARDRMVFPLVGIESSHAVSLLARGEPHRWPAMAVLGEEAARRLGSPVSACEVVELYSCFPAAVMVQQRELGLDRDATPTITGGMAFAGGPFNNFVFQSLAEVVGRLREKPDVRGLVTSVSGLLTKPGLGVWSATPDGKLPSLADLAFEAEARTPVLPVLDSVDAYEGPLMVVTSTVTYDGLEPVQAVAVGTTPRGRRTVTYATSADVLAAAEAGALEGAEVETSHGIFSLT